MFGSMPGERRAASLLLGAVALGLGACATPPAASSPLTSAPAPATSIVTPSPSSERASATPDAPSEPPELFGTWRTTLVGQRVTLVLTPDTYTIIRGINKGDGDVSVDGDRIDFFNSTLCEGTGEYRWTIDGDTLRFSSLTEPCPGRAEALLNLRYGDYSPPD
jgi:hypothetical protein